MLRIGARVALCVGVCSLVGSDAIAQPAGFTEALVASGLSSPTAMEFAPDGRLFVLEQSGRVRVIKNGSLLSTPFMTKSVNSSGERGMLGIAFDPNFASTQYVYLYYTATSPTVHNRVVRVRANGDVMESGSELTLIDLPSLSATNHNGGAIHFGPDGKLYIAVGENAVPANSQSLSTTLGKMLRINADGSIPTDNPFYTQTTGINRAIWAIGLRNPFTFAFGAGGAMHINDVGQETWEEINEGSAGANYGWPSSEGPTSSSGFDAPRFYYGHGSGTVSGCAITGGAFYNPANPRFPSSYIGDYFFNDYCSGKLFHLDTSSFTATTFVSGLDGPVDVKVGDDGRVYYLTNTGGNVYAINYNAPSPSITSHPQSISVSPGSPASFSVSASGATPMSYQWQRNAADIPGATSQSYTIASAQASDNGARFRARVTNSSGNALSNEAVLTVNANTPPVAAIQQPAAGSMFNAGDTIMMSGTGTDSEDGTLPASAFTWEVVFHHDTHTHPFLAPTSGSKTGSFTIPRVGHTETNVFYRIHLTVQDSDGATHTVTRDIQPRLVSLTITTQPAGLALTLDGQPRTAPYTFSSVVGVTRTLGVTSPQTVGSTTYTFSSWSDGGAATHNVDTPASATTYTATFTASGGGGPAPGLVAAYGFNEASGTSVTDSTGNGNTGTINGATRTASGRFGSAISFDGVNDLITIADSASLDLTSGMTLEAWVYPTSGSTWRTVILKEASGDLAYALYGNNTSSRATGWVKNGNTQSTSTTSALALNTWTHLAVTYDGAMLRLYRNGVQEGTKAVTGAITTSTSPLRIGGNMLWTEYFAGTIDEVRVYNRALTATQIQSDMNAPVGGGSGSGDTTAPTVNVTAPAGGSTVSGTINVNGSASDNVGVAGVQFLLDGAALGAEDTTSPYSVSWNTVNTANGAHALSARARDAAGNITMSSSVSVQVSNSAPPPPPPPATGLVAAYAFNEGSGTALTDWSGAGNNGSISGATWTTAGRYGGALVFDGVNDLVTVADSNSLDLTSALTIEAWVYPTATGTTWRTAVMKEIPGELSYTLYANNSSSRAAAWVRIGSNSRNTPTTAGLALNTWTHLAMTYDGSMLRIYRNGALDSSVTVSGAIATSSNPLRLGGNQIWGEYFAGRLDDVRIYNRALSASEIQADLNSAVK
jgi:glucose/arabinose dehydrogenase